MYSLSELFYFINQNVYRQLIQIMLRFSVICMVPPQKLHLMCRLAQERRITRLWMSRNNSLYEKLHSCHKGGVVCELCC